MKCIFYSYTTQGIYIKDSVNDKVIHYIGYSLKEAVQKHRQNFGLQRKHFRLVHI